MKFQVELNLQDRFWFQMFPNYSKRCSLSFLLSFHRKTRNFLQSNSHLYQYHTSHKFYQLCFSSLNSPHPHIFDGTFDIEAYSLDHIDCILWIFFWAHLCTFLSNFHRVSKDQFFQQLLSSQQLSLHLWDLKYRLLFH